MPYGQQNQTPSLSYPLNVLSSEAPFLSIIAKEYQTLTQVASGSGSGPIIEYRLLMPQTVQSSDNLSYEQQSVLKGKAFAEAISSGGTDLGGFVNIAQGMIPDPLDVRGSLQAAMGRSFNPKEELLFKSPDLRTHTFTFNMFAKNKQEAEEIANIIKSLRENAYPAVNATIDTGSETANKVIDLFTKSGGNIFKSPKQFSVEMHPGAGRNAFPRISDAFLTSISTNYAGSGRVSLTPDDYFQGIELTLTFQDIRISTAKDINPDV
jgi:hypothetical protein